MERFKGDNFLELELRLEARLQSMCEGIGAWVRCAEARGESIDTGADIEGDYMI